jgi:hypothetical protein
LTGIEQGQLWVMRIHAAVAAMVILLAAAVLDAVLREKAGLPPGAVALPLLVPLVWMVFFAPGRRWRAWGYAMDAEELQVSRGVWTQVHTVVPLDRVQHIDVSQGPIERGCGVCRLIVHTAGTLHSQVVLPGLARPTAERMRDEIRARIRQEEA